MSRYDFQSGGAAFSDQIAQLLAQRKAEERQRLLDSLTVNADSRAQEAAQREQEQLQLEKQRADVQMAGEKQRQGFERLGQFTQFMEPGDAPPKGMKPEDIQLGQEFNVFKPIPANPADTFVGPEPEGVKAPAPPEPQLGYTGTEAQRTKAQAKTNSAALITKLLSDPQTEELGVAAQNQADLNDGVLSAEFMQTYAGPSKQIYVFDDRTGKMTDMAGRPVDPNHIPSNAQVITRPYPPAKYFADPPAWQYAGQDPTDRNMQIWIDRQGNQHKVPAVRNTGNTGDVLGIPAQTMEKSDSRLAILEQTHAA
jgi:hypothetical protein